jgi:hypothetical protein
MNKSQTRATVGMVAAVISAVCAAVLPQLEALPAEYRFFFTIVSVLGAAAGSVVTLLNQSLSPDHVSVPKETAERLGLISRGRRAGGAGPNPTAK